MDERDRAACRMYLAGPLQGDTFVTPGFDQSHYLLHVLRLADGAGLMVFDGHNGEWQARLERTGKRDVRLHIGAQVRPQPVPRAVTLAFAPLKHARLDYMVQKATEMGATRLVPCITARTQVARVNRERMLANVIEACEQCGVLQVPEVEDPQPFEAWLARQSEADVLVFADEAAPPAKPLQDLANIDGHGGLSLLVGPEGGFSATERALVLARPNVRRISLGPRILRADTAAVAGLALIQAILGT
ncbi:MAG: 16S rRNA (uracil(1498)-N(3))-methyltransferase [Hyphomicrobiales bacterium]|nr:16S rRNA (uracil(1498)-N(3))-methyltransferase [Hyphomicrobiales bacterium]